MKQVLPWTCYASIRDFCSALAASAQYKKLFLIVHYFNAFVPVAQQAGQASVPGRLSLCMCLWSAPMLTVILVEVANVLLVKMIYNCYGTDIVNIMQLCMYTSPPSWVI